MQLVSRKVLDDICFHSRGEVVEAETEFSYSEFLQYYAAQVEAAGSSDYAVKMVYDKVKIDFLKKRCPPIKYIDEGSSRAAYACSGGKCLKIAVNKAGIAQNKQEIDNVPVNQTQYSCFPQNFACDDKTWGSILTECCAPCSYKDFKNFYGLEDGVQEIADLFKFLINKHCELGEAIAELKTSVNYYERYRPAGSRSLREYETNKLYLDILQNMKKSKPAPKYKVLKDLLQFYTDHGSTDDEMTLGDLEVHENWGLACRDGELAPVIIDAGFSAKISYEFYSESSYES